MRFKINITVEALNSGELYQVEYELDGIMIEDDGTLNLLNEENAVTGFFPPQQWVAFAVEKT